MRNFIWFWRRSVPRCKSSMEHSHEQFKQRISFGLLPAAQSVCGCLKVATRPAAAPSSGWSELLAHYGPLPFPLSTAPLKWPRWTENGEVRCGASWVGAESSVYLPHYHLFASNDKKALTASAPAAPPLWFSAHFSPDSILDFFNLHSYFPIKTLAKGKSLHTSNVESGKKCALINFVGCSSSEELKRRKTVIQGHQFAPRPLASQLQPAANSGLTPDNWKPSPASINQTLRRPLISVQNCNYFRALWRNEQTCWMFHQSRP